MGSLRRRVEQSMAPFPSGQRPRCHYPGKFASPTPLAGRGKGCRRLGGNERRQDRQVRIMSRTTVESSETDTISSQNVSSDGHPQERDSQAARTPNTFRSARTSVTRNVSRKEARSSKPIPGKKGKRKAAETAGKSSMPPDLVKGSRRNLRRKRSSR